MKYLSISQCASLFAVDETFVNYVCNRFNIRKPEIELNDIGKILEELLLYREQYTFLGKFRNCELNKGDKCICFELEESHFSTSGKDWHVTKVFVKEAHFHPHHSWLLLEDIAPLTNRYQSIECMYGGIGDEDRIQVMVLPMSNLSLSPPIFNPIIRNGNLYYLDYGKLSDSELISNYRYYDIVRNVNNGYCVLNKEGFRLTEFSTDIHWDDSGAFWLAKEDRWYGKLYAYFNQYGSIRTFHKFNSFHRFSENLCAVSYKYSCKYWGFIDCEGALAIDFYYDDVDEKGFYWGICKVELGSYEGYIDTNGKAVTTSGELLISNAGETYAFAKFVHGKYITNKGQVFSSDGVDLGYAIQDLLGDCYPIKAISSDGGVGYVNDHYEIVIPLIYKDTGPRVNGIIKVVTKDDVTLFVNENNELTGITQEEFDEMLEIAIKDAEIKFNQKNHSTNITSSRRIFTIHFTEWNGLRKIFRTTASSSREAEENFWNSGVKAGAYINSID
mgnify:CR=1 FL=1